MDQQKLHFRHILLFLFRKGQKAADAHREICAVYGATAVSNNTCDRWFARFRSGDFDLNDSARSGRPTSADDDQILAAVRSDRHLTTREIAERFDIHYTTVSDRLKKLGMVKKTDVWVPHELTEKNIMDRILICESLLRWNEQDGFLKRIVTGDEKWVVYNNIKRTKSWCGPGESSQTIGKPDLHPQKVMLSVWWDYKGVVYFELLPRGQTIDSTKYCAQLNKLKRELQQKRPELVNRKRVVFHHDNARPHTSLKTKTKLKSLGWEVMQHPPYSPDLAPSDYHLFRSLQDNLDGKRFETVDDVQKYLVDFFAHQSQGFYGRGIMALPDRWQQIVDLDGQYIVD